MVWPTLGSRTAEEQNITTCPKARGTSVVSCRLKSIVKHKILGTG